MTTPVPGYLAQIARFAGDDWAGSNALTYTVYSVAPSQASDGSLIAGVPMNLTGFKVQGIITVRRECRALPAPTGAIVGDPTLGNISLSLASAFTGLQPQGFSDWSNPDLSTLLVRPKIVDPAGNIITQGLQPLFVF